MYSKKKPTTYLLTAVMLCLMTAEAAAVAFCALRDPVRAIHSLFPNADSHHSVVRAIGPRVRDLVATQLPFTLHFNELGKHTLYVAKQSTTPVGFVHVRSELTEWGLMEIAWALNPDLSIRGLVFQRCRVPACNDESAAELRNSLGGKSSTELLRLLSSNGSSLAEHASINAKIDPALAVAAIRSALKTMAVTAVAWRDEVAEINRQLLLIEQYGQTMGLRLAPQAIRSAAENTLATKLGTDTSIIDRGSVQLFRVSKQEVELGWVASANWKNRGEEGLTHWLFDELGTVHLIRTTPRWPNREIAESFDQLLGTRVASDEVCASAAGLAGYELYFLASHGAE